MTGVIPDGICELQGIGFLVMRRNRLQGSIPDCIGKMQGMRWLSLPENQLSGTLPESLGNVTGLSQLDLAYEPDDFHVNKFTGGLPESFGNMVSMRWLNIGVETLGGRLPNMTLMTSLQDCSFLPSRICMPKNFTNPVISDNREDCDLSVLPDCDIQEGFDKDCGILTTWLPSIFTDVLGCCDVDLADCVEGSITALNLANQGIQGELPDFTGAFKELIVFDASDNEISGPIPASIGEFVKLQELNLAGNALEGSVPTEIGKLVQLTSLNLAKNQLSGIFPASVINLVLLDELDISDNTMITGDVPALLPSVIFDHSGTYLGLEIPEEENTDTAILDALLDESSSSESNVIIIVASVLGALVLIFVGWLYFFISKRKRNYKAAFQSSKIENPDSSSMNMSRFYSEASQATKDFGDNDDELIFIEKINAGAFGEVWKGKHNGKNVAIKKMKFDKMPDDQLAFIQV
jgi:hypothetical protein